VSAGKKDPLIGKWFHSRKQSGVIEWQGTFVARVNDDHYLVQLFDWLIGAPSSMRVASISAMASWSVYDDDEEMKIAYENEPRREP
jgi:hypothetical protein